MWNDGRIVFEYSNSQFWPETSDIAQAEHRLDKALRFANKSRVLWLRRQARLKLAKRLRLVVAPDLLALAKPSRERNPAVARRLSELLIAEALCLNELPVRPSALLARNAQMSRPALRELVRDETAPAAGRALAALVLGSLENNDTEDDVFFASLEDDWMGRAFSWGRRKGLPSEPALLVALLCGDAGERDAERCFEILHTFIHLPFCAQPLREMLAEGEAGEHVVVLLQAATKWEDVARLWSAFFRNLLENPPKFHGRNQKVLLQNEVWRKNLTEVRTQSLQNLADLLRDFLHSTRDETLLVLAVDVLRLSSQLFSLWHGESSTRKTTRKPNDSVEEVQTILPFALKPSEAALNLPPELRRGWLEIVASYYTKQATNEMQSKFAHLLRADLLWQNNFHPLFELLQLCRSATVAREAFERRLHATLSQHHWRDESMYRWFLGVAQTFEPQTHGWNLSQICDVLDGFSSANDARFVFDPVLKALRQASPALREDVFFALLEAGDDTRQSVRDTFSSMLPHIPLLLDFVQQTENDWQRQRAVEAAVQLDKSLRQIGNTASEADKEANKEESLALDNDEAQLLAFYSSENQQRMDEDRVLDVKDAARSGIEEVTDDTVAKVRTWLQWLLGFLRNVAPDDEYGIEYSNAVIATQTAVLLSEGDLSRFQSVFTLAARHEVECNYEHLRQGLSTARSYPALCGALCHLFQRQPRRCLDLLVRLGLATKLGADVLAPLEVLQLDVSRLDILQLEVSQIDNTRLEDIGDSAWNEMLQVAPELQHQAAKYRHLCELLGRSEEPPQGIVQALNEGRKRGGELSHIERLLLSQPQRNDLQKRAASLRARLQNGDNLHSTRHLVAERLSNATAEAHLLLLEQQLTNCYRARLGSIVGALAPDLEMDADLLNATLLSGDIETNRRALRRLLRAHLGQEKRWREEHPANVLFLRNVAHRHQVDTTAWLGEYAKRFRFARATGGRVRLHLETQPLRILQMGNYFDTCLSFGGINSFSTVANACELNKRVIYASDDAGRIVGRKLIGLNSDGKLIGFRTYTSLKNVEENQSLRAIFRRYCADFAARCNLDLSDEGTIPTLFVQEWYDDGVVAWNDEDETANRSSSGAPHRNAS